MTQSAKGKPEGVIHEWKGTIKRKAGYLTNNSGLETIGLAEKIDGKIQVKIGRVEKAIENRKVATVQPYRAATALTLGSRIRAGTGGKS